MRPMRPFGDLTPKEDALRLLLDAASPSRRIEDVPLHEARDRAAADDITSPIDVPPFARATMDGYAVRAEDARDAGTVLRIVGDAFAGSPDTVNLRKGEAARIATGAPLPAGADAVVRVEDTSSVRDEVHLNIAARSGAHVDNAGSDLQKGALVVPRGATLTPARLGLLASIGRASVRVHARPRVAVLSTGDELLAPGQPPKRGRIYDANATSLRALFEGAGAIVTPFPALKDDLAAHRERLNIAAHEHDLVVVSGGASVGSRDLVVDALSASGKVFLHGVRVKPGKPLLAGKLGDALVIGLPGNPTSALSNAALFVLPVLRRLAGHARVDAPRTREARMGAAVAGERERFLFLPVRLDGDVASPTFRGSGALTSLSESDGWVGVPEGGSLAEGARVEVTLW